MKIYKYNSRTNQISLHLKKQPRKGSTVIETSRLCLIYSEKIHSDPSKESLTCFMNFNVNYAVSI